jgi:hypothetical protein
MSPLGSASRLIEGGQSRGQRESLDDERKLGEADERERRGCRGIEKEGRGRGG